MAGAGSAGRSATTEVRLRLMLMLSRGFGVQHTILYVAEDMHAAGILSLSREPGPGTGASASTRR